MGSASRARRPLPRHHLSSSPLPFRAGISPPRPMWHRRALGKSPLGGIEIKGRKSAPKADQVGGEQGVVGIVADPSQPFEIKAPAANRPVHRRQSSGGRRDDRRVGGLIGTKAVPFEAPVGAAGTGQKRRHTGVAVTGGQAAIQIPHQARAGPYPAAAAEGGPTTRDRSPRPKSARPPPDGRPSLKYARRPGHLAPTGRPRRESRAAKSR